MLYFVQRKARNNNALFRSKKKKEITIFYFVQKKKINNILFRNRDDAKNDSNDVINPRLIRIENFSDPI